jgi:predicted nucleic acid-binding protein
MVVFDTTFALILLRPGVQPPLDPATGYPVEHAEARISGLVETLGKARTRIIIPSPALSELLVRAGNGTAELVTRLMKSSTFRVLPFDTRAAIELALMTRAALDSGDKRSGIDAPWTKIKFDRQIVAIAKVAGATAIYSDDQQLRAFAEEQGLKVIGLADLPIPESARQPELPLPEPPASTEDATKESEDG